MASPSMMKSALVVNGEALTKILTEDKLREEFLNVTYKVNVVLACRVSPKQKADIVSTVRNKFPTKTTLSIGDGANDVNMITTAHVGVGITGLEGQ
jgi:phospholipid-transporting ATPase